MAVHEDELTRSGRLGAMLIAAAVLLPVLALAGMLVMRHYVWVHYPAHTLLLWLSLDAAVLAVGLILRENSSVTHSAGNYSKRNLRERRRRARRLR